MTLGCEKHDPAALLQAFRNNGLIFVCTDISSKKKNPKAYTEVTKRNGILRKFVSRKF